jgi:ATP/maltotriose-dependent transcriptional regulator MalT
MEHNLIVKSKLVVPQLPKGVLITNRIRELGIEQFRVVSAVAPAGYGKTTAVLASLHRRDNLHWYRMDREDTRLPIFYAHLLEALFGRFKKQEPESLQYFRSLSDLAQTYDL